MPRSLKFCVVSADSAPFDLTVNSLQLHNPQPTFKPLLNLFSGLLSDSIAMRMTFSDVENAGHLAHDLLFL